MRHCCLSLLTASFLSVVGSSTAFLVDVSSSRSNPPRVDHVDAQMATADEAIDGSTSTRRGWIKKVVGGAVATGIVANKIAIEGPEPFVPPSGSLEGKVVIITGGNTGLGLESAKRLAFGGATVVMTTRSTTKGSMAVKDVKDYLSKNSVFNDNVFALPLDLCDMASVRAFPDLLKQSPALAGGKTIDVLMNNAGVMAIPDRQLTKDGFERTFQTNHLGHFALTALLAPLLNPAGSRVVNVSSMAHLIAGDGLDFSNLNGEKDYGPWKSYGYSKLENILFTKELQRRSDEAGMKITTVALHPGAVRTDLQRNIIGEEKYATMNDSKPGPLDMALLLPAVYFTKAVDRGATSQIWLAAGQGNDVGGKFYINCKETALGKTAMDMDQAKKLWSLSEKMSGVQFNL